MNDKVLILDGNKFSTIDEFYKEAYTVLTSGLDWDVAHNFDAFHDILFGGFGVFESNELVTIEWINFPKSSHDLGLQHSIDYYKLRSSGLTGSRSLHFLKKATDLEEGKGETLFETILEIFAEHPNIILQTGD
jgi:RNAse (barnase) inhibitor barstar